MNNGNNTLSIALAGLILLLAGCDKGNNIPNVDHMSPEFSFYRADQMLADIDSSTVDIVIDSMLVSHPQFWSLFFNNVVPLASDTQSLNNSIRQMCSDQRIGAILDSVDTVYPNSKELEAQFYEAFQYYEYYFPGNKAPNVYTVISDFGFFPFIFEDEELRDGLGVSLEMFLGSDFPYREFAGNHAAFSEYLTRTYNSEHLVKKTIDVLVDDILGPPPGDRLIDLMIHNGKRQYILDLILPEYPDTVLMEFTPEQMEWCEANERNLWAHYLSEDLMYSNEFDKINKLVNYSPSVPGLPPEAPGRVANWSGWQIIKSMADRNPNMNPVDLVGLRDPQQIVELSRYRPK